MITSHVQYDAGNAKEYFRDELNQQSYYTQNTGSEFSWWQGKGAEKLGLQGTVHQKDFHALIDNLHPKKKAINGSQQSKSKSIN